MQYDTNKNVSLILATIPTKALTEGTKVFRSLIEPSIKEGDCYDACNFVARHCENCGSQIKGIYFYQSYSSVSHAESFRINIAVVAMHRLTAKF